MSRFGDLNGISIEGTPFRTAMESDFQPKPGHIIEKKTTSGDGIDIYKKQNPAGEGVKIIGGKDVFMKLQALSKKSDLQIGVKDAEGKVWSCIGSFSIQNGSTMSGEIPITINPNSEWV